MPTPTREQLAELLEEVKRWIYHQQPAEEDNARKKLDHVIACLAAPPPEPQAMPPIEKGDWVEDSIRIRPILADRDAEWWNSPEAVSTRLGVTGIRKANGTVWTREPRR